MATTVKRFVFWVVAPCSLVDTDRLFRGAYCHCPDDGGSKFLWDVGQYLPEYTAQQPRKQLSLNVQQTDRTCLRFEVLVVVKMSIVDFWVMTSYHLAGGYKRFGGTYRLHLHGRSEPI
jgi:hypothetical protein